MPPPLDSDDAGAPANRRAARRGTAYARKLDEAGVDVTNVRYNGAIHDFALLNALLDVPSTATALRQAAADLAYHLR